MKKRPDGILLAGDLYDRPVPSAEAVQLFDSFLTRLAQRKLPVYAISGNHDSAERIAFGAHIMSSSGICMSPVYDGKTAKYCLTDSYGEVWIHLFTVYPSFRCAPCTCRGRREQRKSGLTRRPCRQQWNIWTLIYEKRNISGCPSVCSGSCELRFRGNHSWRNRSD